MRVRAVAWVGVRTDRYAQMTSFLREVPSASSYGQWN